MNKLQPNRLNDNITKMILLNLISQEYNKYIHYKIEKDKFKSVLKDLLKNPQEFNESSESQELHKPQEIHESSSEFIMKNEIEQIENHLEFDNIYEKKELDEIIYYQDQPKLKTVAKSMYSKNNLDKLIKKKKW